jgi:hypothetical protein
MEVLETLVRFFRIQVNPQAFAAFFRLDLENGLPPKAYPVEYMKWQKETDFGLKG